MHTRDFITRVEWEPEHDEPNAMLAFDEIVTGPVDMVHIERMSDGTYWMGIYKGDVRQVVVFHTRREAKLYARTEAD
jgi:hypothetical protein